MRQVVGGIVVNQGVLKTLWRIDVRHDRSPRTTVPIRLTGERGHRVTGINK